MNVWQWIGALVLGWSLLMGLALWAIGHGPNRWFE